MTDGFGLLANEGWQKLGRANLKTAKAAWADDPRNLPHAR